MTQPEFHPAAGSTKTHPVADRASAGHVGAGVTRRNGTARNGYGVVGAPSVRIAIDGSDPGANNYAADGPSESAAGHTVQALEATICGLQERQLTLGTIEQAKGMLMAYYAIPADTAFKVLVRWSQHSNTKVRDIAALIVAAGSQPDQQHPYEALRALLRAHHIDPSTISPPVASTQSSADGPIA